MVKTSTDLDRYLKLKEKDNLTIFVFLLGDEYPHLDNDSAWIHYVKERVYLVRLREDEFGILDIGIHPKTIVYKKGRELKEYNGIPQLHAFRKDMANLRRRTI